MQSAVPNRKDRPVQSCGECRRRKIKCDRVFPCGPCKLRGQEAHCLEFQRGDVIGSTRPELTTLVRTIEKHEAYIQLLNDRLNTLEKTLSPDAMAFRTISPTFQSAALQDIKLYDDSHEIPDGSHTPSADDNEAALALEDLAWNRQHNIDRSLLLTENAQHLLQNLGPTTEAGIPYRELQQLPDFYCLPAVTEANELLQVFYNYVEWRYRVLHLPTFKKTIHEFLQLPATSRLTRERYRFLALYCCILCAALSLSASSPNRDIRCERLWNLSRFCLDQAEWAQYHDIVSLQTIILSLHYLNWIGKNETAWIFHGAATKIAFNLGLSQLGPELPADATDAQIQRRFGKRWLQIVDREVGRRVWLNLCLTDLFSSLEHRHSLSIHPSQNHSILPANVNDEDLRGVCLPEALSGQHLTSMSYALELYRSFVPRIALNRKFHEINRLDYAMITCADKEQLEIWKSRPAYFDASTEIGLWTSDPTQLRLLSLQRESTLHAYLSSVIRLHRPYFFRAFKDSRFAESRNRVVECASQMVLQPLTDRVEMSQWPHISNLFLAVLMLLVEQHHREHMDDQLLLIIRQGITYLRSNSQGTFGNSWKLLQRVLDKQLAKTSCLPDTGMKRSAEVRDLEGQRTAKYQKMTSPENWLDWQTEFLHSSPNPTSGSDPKPGAADDLFMSYLKGLLPAADNVDLYADASDVFSLY